jgi:DNA-binding transcriptional LysR family regulator
LIARRIGTTQMVCCASPGYVARYGSPATPADLARHRCLAYAYLAVRDAWPFRDRAGRGHVVKIAGPVHANNGRFLAEIAAADGGIALEPDFIVGDAIRAGRLVALLPDFAPPESPIYAVYPSRRHLSAKVRTFVEFLVARFEREAPWRLGAAPLRGRRRKK